MKKKYSAICWLIGILFVLGIWTILIEPNIIEVEKISFNIKNLPASFVGTKIIHLSDLHSRNYGRQEKKILEILEQLNPDFIFITGDIIDWSTKNFKSCQIFWKELSKKFENRVFAVYGNHEYKNCHFKTFDKIFKQSGIKVLNNQSEKIENNEDFIYLVGIDHPYPDCKELKHDKTQKRCRDYLQKTYNNNLQIALEKTKEEKTEIPIILLAHSPEVFREVKNYHQKFSGKIDLVLAGHTHGGQINIPFLIDFILPLEYDKQYKKGLFRENSTYLYVSRGVGNSGLPIRFNSFPEITLIEIKPD
jgi:predicted MPP superfamily phosphohydrolase